ncbi:unnamed protein product, partial [Mesorhabditis belari]|uniref:Uncharacterized protein n=1 Tax=Mesorhabditis belari TaxID=2138241 RepID=A0AAF3F7J4_9BILA
MLSTGHRCIIMWLHTLFILLVLVIYLDKDKDSKDPILLFGYLALSDVITVLGILANLVHKSLQRMSELAEARIHWINAVCVYKENFVYLLIVVLKMLFELFLYWKLHYSDDGPSFITIMAPLWAALLIILYDLTRRLYRIQTANQIKTTLNRSGETSTTMPLANSSLGNENPSIFL